MARVRGKPRLPRATTTDESEHMNKKELSDAIASSTDLNGSQATAALDAAVETISAALKKGDKVTIAGFGTFETRQRSARTGRNPQTGETMQIAASTTPAFKPAAGLKRAVDN
ncbi:HU family DNA-binding protein [uncultured Nocardioides sp.]|uniref:HU family DNA-binding protein n=1 Tax=uncultured Nocardioides sp. TaxID=198441 RepID=UPI0026108A24|nr:HU family DNA-binding protein [uncultured Nocardioides sp.]